MITVVQELPHINMNQLERSMLDKVFECPVCGKRHMFFSYSERICSVCGSDMPPVDKIMTDELQRKLYHFDDNSDLMTRFLNVV